MGLYTRAEYEREIQSRGVMSVHVLLFQAGMWREFAQAWDGRYTMSGIGREWVAKILRVSREECLRRAWINLYLARKAQQPPIPEQHSIPSGTAHARLPVENEPPLPTNEQP